MKSDWYVGECFVLVVEATDKLLGYGWIANFVDINKYSTTAKWA